MLRLPEENQFCHHKHSDPAGTCVFHQTTKDLIQKKNICLDIFITFPTSDNLEKSSSESTFPIKVDSMQVTDVYSSASTRYDCGSKGEKCVSCMTAA